MGLLNWLRGRSGPAREPTPSPKRTIGPGHPPPGTSIVHDGPGLFELEVVGESNYQAALERVCGGRTGDGHDLRVKALLVLEDANPYDSNAVRVDIDGQAVGYLSRRHAVQYRRALAATGYGRADAYCDAVIRGGWDRGGGDRGHFGVRLDIPMGGDD